MHSVERHSRVVGITLKSAGDIMAFVAVFVFRQKLRPDDVQSILQEIPESFSRLAQNQGLEYSTDRVGVTLIDGAPRNVFSPESHVKGLQGLDILLLVFAQIPNEEDRELLREELESRFRDRWVARARIFSGDPSYWKAARWLDDAAMVWSPSG